MDIYSKLRCNYYSEGVPMRLESEEYLVTFKSLEDEGIKPIIRGQAFPPEGESWCIVRRADVSVIDDKSGLVEVIIQEFLDSERAKVKMFNAPDMKWDTFTIDLSEIPIQARIKK